MKLSEGETKDKRIINPNERRYGLYLDLNIPMTEEDTTMA
jgi:hypothetical protein